jgi:AcrR family transcriptional regulator
VAASQRERLLRSMTELACRRGYQQVRVGDLVQHAGVSRRTFYELYDGKEECLIAAYAVALERLLTPTLTAYEAGDAWLDRLRRALDALLAALAADPLAARLCFVEVFAGGPLAVARRNRGMAALDRLFEGPDGAGGQPPAVAAGRVGDLAEILNREIAGGRTERLPELRGELMYTLVLPYLGPEAATRELERSTRAALPANGSGNGGAAATASRTSGSGDVDAARASTNGATAAGNGHGGIAGRDEVAALWARPAVDLSRGHHGLPRDEVLAIQRARLLRALVTEVAERGYQELTIRSLAQRAGVSARSVYELFDGKEDCFLAAYDEIADHLEGLLGRALDAAGGTPAGRLGAAVETLLDFCAREPDLARAALVEVVAAGPTARARREQTMRRLAALVEPSLRELRPDGQHAQVAARAVVGGVHELIYDAVDRRDAAALPDQATIAAAAQGGVLVPA